MQTACITGITGQAGSYLADLLIAKGYKVYGLKRRASSINTSRLDHIYIDPHIDNSRLELAYGDLGDYDTLANWIGSIKPDLLFNMAAMSHVRVSFDIPITTMDITGTGVLRVLEAIRTTSPKTRFLTASSSEMFGASPPPQNEQTLFHPRSPYAVAKVAGYYATINYREAYDLFATNAISFNYESPRRGETFVTQKTVRACNRIYMGLEKNLFMGNLDASRDWSHCADVVDAMFRIITADKPDDFVVASGKTHTVREMVDMVFRKRGMDYKEFVKFDEKYIRKTEVDALCGDATKLKTTLGWKPKYTFEALIDEMLEEDLKVLRKEIAVKKD